MITLLTSIFTTPVFVLKLKVGSLTFWEKGAMFPVNAQFNKILPLTFITDNGDQTLETETVEINILAGFVAGVVGVVVGSVVVVVVVVVVLVTGSVVVVVVVPNTGIAGNIINFLIQVDILSNLYLAVIKALSSASNAKDKSL